MYSPQRVTGPCLEADSCSAIHFHTVLLPVEHLWHCRARGRVVGVLSVCVSAVLERRVENDERVGKSVHLVADAKLSPVWVKAAPHSRVGQLYAHRQLQTQQMSWHLTCLGSLTCYLTLYSSAVSIFTTCCHI